MIRRKIRRMCHNLLRDVVISIVEEEMQVGGHCGICGRSMPNELFDKDWSWGICQKCWTDTEQSLREREMELKK